MSYTFLQEQGEESSAGCFSDIEPFVRSRLNLTAEKSSCSDSETASCLGSLFGTMCEHSMESRGEALQTLCAEGSPARILAKQDEEKESAEIGPGCGQNLLGSLAKYDHDTSLWKIHQCSLFADSDEFLEIWPRSGTMRNGIASMREQSVPLIYGTESGSMHIPTPCCSDATRNGKSMRKITETSPNRGVSLSHWWHREKRPGHVNPIFAEWLMNWPIGWTDLKPLETDKYQQWFEQHGRF